MQQRRRIKHEDTFQRRLIDAAARLREQARLKPPGVEREGLLRRARQTDVAIHIDEWLSSPGLRSPK